MAATSSFVCACCQRAGSAASFAACNGCQLVHYCGRKCQEEHWQAHKKSCKSPLMKETWQPEWARSDRTPSFVDKDNGNTFGGKKFFWGNMPALDIFQLSANEGETYPQDLELLFAASGDLRNVIKTVAGLPSTYTNAVFMTLNDRELDIVARNAILLLTCLAAPDKETALDCMIHVWYSSMIRQKDLHLLNTVVRPLFEDVVCKIAEKPAKSLQGKTWRFGSVTARLTLSKNIWTELLLFFEVPTGITAADAQRIRTGATMARRDVRERNFISQLPAHRVCKEKFRTNGILLPFGNSIEAFDVPNPTFFQTAEWPMNDAGDPLDGWSWAETLEINSGLAKNDLYSKLYIHVKHQLASFYDALRSRTLGFSLFHMKAEDLPDHLPCAKFARIETPAENYHATLLTLFMNAVVEIFEGHDQGKIDPSEHKLVEQYEPFDHRMLSTSMYNPNIIAKMDAVINVRDGDKHFDRYMQVHRFDELAKILGIAMKAPHTIVEKWPLRLKLRPHQQGGKEEFKRLLTSSQLGVERYVEWMRTE